MNPEWTKKFLVASISFLSDFVGLDVDVGGGVGVGVGVDVGVSVGVGVDVDGKRPF